MTGTTDFIGAGWSFPTRITATGSIRLLTGTDDIDSALRIILRTRPGERLMRPEFGCAMWDQVFAPITPGTLGLVEQAVRDAVERWEPRVTLEHVDAVPGGLDGVIEVRVEYRVVATNDRRNLVYPFYVIPQEEIAP